MRWRRLRRPPLRPRRCRPSVTEPSCLPPPRLPMKPVDPYPVAIGTKPGRGNLLGIGMGILRGSLSTRAWTALVAACAGLLTLVSGVTSVLHLAYFSPLLHVAVET